MRLDEKNLTKVGEEPPYLTATKAVRLLQEKLGTMHNVTFWRWVKFVNLPYDLAPGLRKAYRFKREDVERLPELVEKKKAEIQLQELEAKKLELEKVLSEKKGGGHE